MAQKFDIEWSNGQITPSLISALLHDYPGRLGCLTGKLSVEETTIGELSVKEIAETCAEETEIKEQTVITQHIREVLMMGDYVAVCWNGRYIKEPLPSLPMHKITAQKWQRAPLGPYVDFVWLRKDPSGNPYEDEINPVWGGITVDMARQVASELIKAAEYIETLKDGER